jgi:hypothetical protein
MVATRKYLPILMVCANWAQQSGISLHQTERCDIVVDLYNCCGTQHYAMLQRNLLYTGVTRGKKLVVLVGQKKAVAIAVRNVSGRRRWSKLQEWLRPNPSLSQQIDVAS